MADSADPRRKTSPLPFERHEGAIRPLARASSRFALPTVAALLRAGAVVSAAATVGAVVVACGHEDDAPTITADEHGRSGAVKAAIGVVRGIEVPTASASTTARTVPTEPIRMAGAPPPIRALPVTRATTSPHPGLTPPIPPTTTPPPPAGGPRPITPTPVPPTPGGKVRAVVPGVPKSSGTDQAPCPSPNGGGTTT